MSIEARLAALIAEISSERREIEKSIILKQIPCGLPVAPSPYISRQKFENRRVKGRSCAFLFPE
jgi:hypothetical protein